MRVKTKKNLKNAGIAIGAIAGILFVITQLTKGQGKTTISEPFQQIKNLFT